MAWMCWSQQGCLLSRASTYQCHLLHLVWVRVHVRVALVSHICHSWDCYSISEHTCQNCINQSRAWQRWYQSHTCQSHIIRAKIVRDYIRAYFHSRDCERLGQSHTCQSRINQTGIVSPYYSHPCHSWVAMYTRSCCSANLMRKILIISGWSLTADRQLNASYPQYMQIAISWWSGLECLLTSHQHAFQCKWHF